MAIALVKRSSSKPLAELQLSFPLSQSWNSFQNRDVPPVFLASQVVAGSVCVRYLDASLCLPGDKVQINLMGADQRLPSDSR